MASATAAERPAGRAAAALPPAPRVPPAFQTLAILLRPVEFAERCRRRFGDTFRLHFLPAGEVVMVSDPESLKRLFAADRVNTIAPGRNLALEPLLGPRSILLLAGDEHLRRRKVMLPPFHGERMRAYETAIERATRRELARWPGGTAFALHPRMQAITLDVILAAVFGVGEERREKLRGNLVEILAATRSPATIGITMRRLAWLPRFRHIRRLVARTDELLQAEIAERRADRELEAREDILSMLVAARFEDGDSMDDAELRDQLMTLLVAGHETTATALAWTFELLFRAPAEHDRARAAARSGDDAYLDAVATEALRLRPVVPFTGRKLLQPIELDGYELPDQTVVLASIWLAHTKELTFPQPYEFKPERFTAGGAPETYSWVPFGGGTRRCLGAAFAQLEMRVVLRTVLREAILDPASAREERIVRRNVTLAPAHGTPAILRARGS
jgi:cytochrome P450 family 135